MSKNKKDRSQLMFGVRCVLLALVIIVISASFIYAYLTGGQMNTVDIILNAAAIVLTMAVMFFEIHSYRKFYNEGVRQIYHEKDIELDKLEKFKQLVSKDMI